MRCITQAGYEVEAGSKSKLVYISPENIKALVLGVYKNEKLEIADWTAQRSGGSAYGNSSGTEEDSD